jgi:tetratricopeptide (TPR) repeat protein
MMKTLIGWIVFLLLVVMLPDGWAQQTTREQPTPATPPATQELTLEQFARELITAAQANDEQRINKLIKDNPGTVVDLYQRSLELGKETGEEAQFFRVLSAFLEQFPIVQTLAQAQQLNQQVADLYQQGRYAEAIPLYQRSLAILEKALGPEHPNVASNLNNLALLYHSLGDYAKAEPLYQRALAIDEKALGLEHPNVATDLNNLAALYDHMGAYAKAEPLLQRALAIREKVLGPEHPDVAFSLNNLAGLYYSLGEYAKAEPLYQRALAIYEKALGPEHPAVATSLNNLAELYGAMGAYANAEPLYQRALAIREKVLGPEHPAVAASLNNLALLYDDMGTYAKAEPLFQRALAIVEKSLGPEHPYMAASLNNLALLHAALDNVEQAHTLFKQAQQIDEKLIDQVMGFTSEKQKLAFLATKQWNLYGFFSLVSQHLVQDLSARKDVLDVWLRRKGVILEAQKRFQEALVYSDNPEAVTTFQELARVRAQLSKLVFAGPGKEGSEAYKQHIAELEQQKEQLEAQLSRLSQAYSVKQKIAKADVAKVVKALPANTVLVEFARVGMFNFKAKGKEEKWHPAHYLAFVLHAGSGEQVAMLDLGEADPIDQAVAVFKKQVSQISRRDPEGLKAIEASKQVYQMVFAPLQTVLGEVKEIFISPDGNLNLIPFEVLVGPDGRFLIEDYTFNYLAAGRDIVGFGEIKEQGSTPVLMGDPDFDLEPTPGPSLQGKGNAPTPNPSQEGNYSRSADMRGFSFQPLPWTKKEVEAIQALLGKQQAAMYTGKEAKEEVLLQSRAPRILHLATHGFFLEDQDLSGVVQKTLPRAILIVPEPPVPAGLLRFENPLLRSLGSRWLARTHQPGRKDNLKALSRLRRFWG